MILVIRQAIPMRVRVSNRKIYVYIIRDCMCYHFLYDQFSHK